MGGCCTGACGASFVFLLIAMGLTTGAVATAFWLQSDAMHWGLWQWSEDGDTVTLHFDIEKLSDSPDWLNGVRGCALGSLALGIVIMLWNFCYLCVEEGRKKVTCCVFFWYLLASGAAVAGTVVFALFRTEDESSYGTPVMNLAAYDLGWSFYLQAIGAGFFVIAMFSTAIDCCSTRNSISV